MFRSGEIVEVTRWKWRPRQWYVYVAVVRMVQERVSVFLGEDGVDVMVDLRNCREIHWG